jgi:hypothetical protein
MAEQEKSEGFFRKVVRFVANPTTEWAELGSRQEQAQELASEKGELRAMIERKRRNDFARRSEFDMLRKVRREGLTPEQRAILGSVSARDAAQTHRSGLALPRADHVKAKIDEIEQQMADEEGLAIRGSPRDGFLPGSGFATTQPLMPDPGSPRAAAGGPPNDPSGAAAGQSPDPHDPEIDEAVIAFANADFDACEAVLRRLTGPGGMRSRHAETWMLLFDLYRATGQHARFESVALAYTRQFGWSAPPWYSLPQRVADKLADEAAAALAAGTDPRLAGEVGWVCPERLDIAAVTRLRSHTLQLPRPWVFDWRALHRVEPEAAMQLSILFRLWSGQSLEMRWLGGARLFQVLAESAPTGLRDADPAYWLTRLDALRLANLPSAFDEAAIDYCVTYEVSPPSWEATRCTVHITDSAAITRSPPMSIISDVSTVFSKSGWDETEAGGGAVVHAELSGQLIGDISATLAQLHSGIGAAPVVRVSCARLIRVDFIAAGELLNWVLARRGEARSVKFIDAHRLLALFFGAMGISGHAEVEVRQV